MALNEADTCRVYVTPKIKESGWEELPHVMVIANLFGGAVPMKAAVDRLHTI